MPLRTDRAGSVSTGEQDEAIRQLIAIGEEKGYLLREEIDSLLPADVASREVDGLLSRCRDTGIDVDSMSTRRRSSERVPTTRDRTRTWTRPT